MKLFKDIYILRRYINQSSTKNKPPSYILEIHVCFISLVKTVQLDFWSYRIVDQFFCKFKKIKIL